MRSQGRPIEEFHRNERERKVRYTLEDAMDCQHMGIVHLRRGAGFVLESLAHGLKPRQLRTQELEGDIARQLLFVRLEDHAVGSASDLFPDVIIGELSHGSIGRRR